VWVFGGGGAFSLVLVLTASCLNTTMDRQETVEIGELKME
jgi:hypothetical protein